MDTDRRNILLGSGLAALALSGCKENGARGSNAAAGLNAPPRRLRIASFDKGWNYGDAPWDRIDEAKNPETNVVFNPGYVTVLHLELEFAPSLILKGRRAHFAVDTTQPNTQAGIQPQVRNVINYMNGSVVDRPKFLLPGNDKIGLTGFGFRKGQHHFVIYVKNPGLTYNHEAPIWFGLWRAGLPLRPASPNRSFFDAEVFTDGGITTGVKEFIYAKNYFRTADEDPYDINNPSNRGDLGRKNLVYSLNINGMINSSDNPALQIPIILDPDTGNMGTGGGGTNAAGPDD